MPAPFKRLNLSDVYVDSYAEEVRDSRRIIGIYLKQIFLRQFSDTGMLKKQTYAELTNRENYTTDLAFHFTRKLIEYFFDLGDLTLDSEGKLVVGENLIDTDPDDSKLEAYLADHPHNQVLYGFLRNVRDVMGEVIYKGEDSLLTLIIDDFHKSMALWTELMERATLKLPCHQVIVRALKEKLKEGGPITVFEGGAGIGAVLREALVDEEFLSLRDQIGHYYFTDIGLSLIKICRKWVHENGPEDLQERITYKVVNLDKLDLPDVFAQDNSVDVIALENVLHDVKDLHHCLTRFREMLKPNGILVFSGAFRLPPKDFFMFEFMQSSFASYYNAELEPEYREHFGWLTESEWDKSLKRAGFGNVEFYPSQDIRHSHPFGGVITQPIKQNSQKSLGSSGY